MPETDETVSEIEPLETHHEKLRFPKMEPVEPGVVVLDDDLAPGDFESEQAFLFFAATWGGADTSRFLDVSRRGLDQALGLTPELFAKLIVSPALTGNVSSVAGCLLIDLRWIKRWLWLWEELRRAAELRERIRRIVTDPELTGEEKTKRIRELTDRFWVKIATPLGPDGLRYDETTKRRYLETTRGPTKPATTDADLSPVLRAAARRVLERILQRTIGPVLALLEIDSAEIIETGAAAFVDKLSIQGTIHLEATWAQLWAYPADRKDESLRLIDSKTRPALAVAVRIAGAVNPSSFGLGQHFQALDAELSPVLELVQRLLEDFPGLVEDYVNGQYQLPDVNLREARSAAARLLSGLENLADSPGSGMTCPPATRTTAGNRQTIKRVCARTIYFGLLSGPERPVVGPDWPGAIEVYPVASINVHVLPQTSEVFLKHHGLYYTGQVELSYRTDIDAVLKEALEETARAMVKKAIERITDKLKSLGADELKRFWEQIKRLRRPR